MTIDYGQANLAVSCALIDQLAVSGVRHAVVCPGSRSTPAAVALAAHPDIRVWVQVDERSAAYFALGMARQLGAPVIVLCTSGTAAANFGPAIAEAELSRIPLLVLTADRPPELRDWGAAQTIDQPNLFGNHVLWSVDMPVPDGDPGLTRHARAVARRAVDTAFGAAPGPVHLNLPFREPLLPAGRLDAATFSDAFLEGRGDVAPRPSVLPAMLAAAEIAVLADQFARHSRGIIVCGPNSESGDMLATSAVVLSAATGYPVLADPLSGVRYGDHDRGAVIDCYDSFLRDRSLTVELAPELVIRTGAIPTSKPLQQFLATHASAVQLLFDPGDPRDPFHLSSHLPVDPAGAFDAIAGELKRRNTQATQSWLACWQTIDQTTAQALRQALELCDELSEARTVAEMTALLPDGATLMAGNSMPVRDVDTFGRGDDRRLRVVGNRGANGIDGVASSALGAAAVSDGPVLLIVGDLSFYHDLNGLLAAKQFGLSATIVVINNDGGGIFSFLPQAEQLDATVFEALFGTPIGLDIAAAARLYGAGYERPADPAALRSAVCRSLDGEGLTIIEIVTDRQHNLAQHRAINAQVAEALATWRTEAPLRG